MKLKYYSLIVLLILAMQITAQNKNVDTSENVIAYDSIEISPQTKYEDSINNTVEVKTIQKNVEKFFIRQNKRFNYMLKGLDKEFIVYCTPTYENNGSLSSLSIYNSVYKHTKFELFDSIPEQVTEYATFLLNRTKGQWCKERFGYDSLELGDDLGIMFIFSPKNIPDSISILKLNGWYSEEEMSNAKGNKKRMFNLSFVPTRYYNLSAGLHERFVRVVLKY
jgi:hypothetical protein